MLRQYNEIKSQQKDSILFFRLGDFYEMFGDDAVMASKILNITLTARGRGTTNEMAMCGVPYHAADGYIAKLIRAGKRVAICEQTSTPGSPGIVERTVVRVVTPGTVLDDAVLNGKSNNYIVALNMLGPRLDDYSQRSNLSVNNAKKSWGLAVADLTTGDFRVTELSSLDQLSDELCRLKPSEVIVSPGFWQTGVLDPLKSAYPFTQFNPSGFHSNNETLQSHFKVHSLASFGLEAWPSATEAAGLLLSYLFETQKTSLGHFRRIVRYKPEEFMLLDETTIKNLELLESLDGQVAGSLVSVLDNTFTAMGGRLLKHWLLHPLRDLKQIENRLEAVSVLVKNAEAVQDLAQALKSVLDIERLLARIGCLRANARDLIALKNSLNSVPLVKKVVQGLSAQNFLNLYDQLKEQREVIGLISTTIIDEPPMSIQDGGIIKPGCSPELDELQAITSQGKEFIRALEQKEIERTGIGSLKVRFNTVFGYYIEISKTNLPAVPQDYIRKQTLVNAERFITPELKQYEEKVFGAEEKMRKIEYKIFCEIRDKVAGHFGAIQLLAGALAEVDVYLSLAQSAVANRYSKPLLGEDGTINIINGRHPVIEKYLSHAYVPNDTFLDSTQNRLIMLTGPNMSGKSSFLRQISLIVLLAQIGSFVPAESSQISLVDRIFTRVGASDNLARGQSTFMVEMQEAANILNNATADSLIILDELGRGTSTYDGVSIAWAIAEHLHNHVRAKTLFATHYHELIAMASSLESAQNYCVAVKENPDGVVFLHKVLKGGIDKSYGIEVAKLAGLPEEVIWRAKAVLKKLETKPPVNNGQDTLPFLSSTQAEHPALTKLKKINPEEITPLQALQLVTELKNELKS